MSTARINFVSIARTAVLTFAVSSGCSGNPSQFIDRPIDIDVVIVSSTHPYASDRRLPITFNANQDCNLPNSRVTCFTIDLRVRNLDGTTRTSFTGPTAWLRLSMPAGQIVSTSTTTKGIDVAAQNVHLVDGEAKGVVVKVIAAYGDTRIIAQNVGFVPAAPGKVAECADGEDNDRNGFADYPHDPGCLFLNDDSEGPFDPAYGVSSTIAYVFPRIQDVRGRKEDGNSSSSPYASLQVEMLGPDTQMIVTAVTSDGMYVTDVAETRGIPTKKDPVTQLLIPDDTKVRTEANSIFVFNFNAPYGVRACDRLTRLAGNISEFFGFTEVGTPGWSNTPWLGQKDSGPCPLPAFFPVTDTVASSADQMEALESAMVSVKNPVIGTHFGSIRPPSGVPSDGASNCDLNGDGIVGFSKSKPGFRPEEKACNDACTADALCTEWNGFRQHSEAKITFGNGGQLFFQPTQLPGFDATQYVGVGKFAELRGVVRNYIGPTPSNILVPRCQDDVIYAGTPLSKIKDAQHACVRSRAEDNSEGN
ncbi:MAG: hypothetical protein NVSMB1_12220 [Polyangiales bacterium]